MSEKAEIPEALVEEIARIVCRPSTGCSWDWKEGVDRAKLCITRIGNAILSGKYPELDEALGVAGRGTMELFVGEKQSCWAGFLLTEEPIANQPPTFIALPPTGTGLKEAIANLEAHSERLEEFIARREEDQKEEGK